MTMPADRTEYNVKPASFGLFHPRENPKNMFPAKPKWEDEGREKRMRLVHRGEQRTDYLMNFLNRTTPPAELEPVEKTIDL